MSDVTNGTENRQKEAFLKSLEGGVTIKDACDAAGISRVTAWRWRKSKSFKEKVLAIIDSRTQTVEDALYASALKGNVAAQIFWLKNRGMDRWKDRFVSEITGAGGEPIRYIIEPTYERPKEGNTEGKEEETKEPEEPKSGEYSGL